MAAQPSVSREVVVRSTPLPQAAGATLHWDDRCGVCSDVEPSLSACVRQPSFQAKEPPMTAHRAKPYWTTRQIGCVPALPPQAIAWAKEAALITFSLPPVLLAATVHTVLPGATGELVWLPWEKQTASPPCCAPCAACASPRRITPGRARHACTLFARPRSPTAPHGAGAAGRDRRRRRGGAAVRRGVGQCARGAFPQTLCRLAVTPAPDDRRTRAVQATAHDSLYTGPSRAGVRDLRQNNVPARLAMPSTSLGLPGISFPRKSLIAGHTRRGGADEPGPLCQPVQAGHRADAPPVRDHLQDGAREAAAGRDRHAHQRDRSPGGLRRPESLHGAVSEARLDDPPGLQKHHTTVGMSGTPVSARRPKTVVAVQTSLVRVVPCSWALRPPHAHALRTIPIFVAQMSQTARAPGSMFSFIRALWHTPPVGGLRAT
jgi:hypothetical protein